LQDGRIDHGTVCHGHHLPTDHGRGQRGDNPVLNGETLLEVLRRLRGGKRNTRPLAAGGQQAGGNGVETIVEHRVLLP
jgi:hypothetical protein